MALSLEFRRNEWLAASLLLILCGWLQGCSSPPKVLSTVAPNNTFEPPTMHQEPPAQPLNASSARDAAEYRRHAAQHVYTRHAPHIYSGPMPPLLQAVGVVDLEIDEQGGIRHLRWLRPPTHVPAVMQQIEQMIYQAAPYPAPTHLQRVTYTDTWLWHHSGRFQLHTLSEGQLGEIEPSASKDSPRRVARRINPASTKTAKCSQPTPPTGSVAAYC